MMEIEDNIEMVDLSVYLKKEKILVITDFHIGLEEAMNKQGFLIPRFQFKEMMQRLERILQDVNPKKIVILGDLKHEFGSISKQEWNDTLKLLDYLARHTDEIILLKGNHDNILGPIATKRKVRLHDHYYENNYYFAHGDKIPEDEDFKNSKTVFMGHEHPAVSVRDELRAERYKCFLKGEFRGKRLIVLPSFSLVSEGTDILKESLLSPILKEADIDSFNVYVVADKLYDFGELRKLRNL